LVVWHLCARLHVQSDHLLHHKLFLAPTCVKGGGSGSLSSVPQLSAWPPCNHLWNPLSNDLNGEEGRKVLSPDPKGAQIGYRSNALISVCLKEKKVDKVISSTGAKSFRSTDSLNNSPRLSD